MSQSVIIIPVPIADPIVGDLRKKYDKVSLHGMRSHVTLLFPFKDSALITPEVLGKIAKIFLKVKKFSFALTNIKTFPNVIFLEPNPRTRFIEITKAIARVFPENPPWEGKFPSINPHLTIGAEIEAQIMNSLKKEITRAIQDKLPVKTIAREAWLMIEQNGEWKIKKKFRFRI